MVWFSHSAPPPLCLCLLHQPTRALRRRRLYSFERPCCFKVEAKPSCTRYHAPDTMRVFFASAHGALTHLPMSLQPPDHFGRAAFSPHRGGAPLSAPKLMALGGSREIDWNLKGRRHHCQAAIPL
ncbi:MAG: hypothetical protein J3K34DRAFT_420246 [Monoraphidium minutum]|nr:MAG: hypothetical protein J3K34DRAFT_420246 [Monoraphidium minutum]